MYGYAVGRIVNFFKCNKLKKFHLMVQVRQGSINFRRKTGMPGVGKIFCNQPVCKVPSSPSRDVWNLIFIWHCYKCTETMSPTICHWTAIAKKSTRGGTVSLTVIINWLIPSELNTLLLFRSILAFPYTAHAPVYDHLFILTYAGIEESKFKDGMQEDDPK